jgi:hypothetical protein
MVDHLTALLDKAGIVPRRRPPHGPQMQIVER